MLHLHQEIERRHLLHVVVHVLEAFELGADAVLVTLEDVIDALFGVVDRLLFVGLRLLVKLTLEEELRDAAADGFQVLRDEVAVVSLGAYTL